MIDFGTSCFKLHCKVLTPLLVKESEMAVSWQLVLAVCWCSKSFLSNRLVLPYWWCGVAIVISKFKPKPKLSLRGFQTYSLGSFQDGCVNYQCDRFREPCAFLYHVSSCRISAGFEVRLSTATPHFSSHFIHQSRSQITARVPFFSGRGRLIQSEDTSLGSRVHYVLLSRCPAKTPSPTLIIVYQDQSLSRSLSLSLLPSAPPVLPPSGRDQRWCGNYICRLLVRRRRLHMSPRRERN